MKMCVFGAYLLQNAWSRPAKNEVDQKRMYGSMSRKEVTKTLVATRKKEANESQDKRTNNQSEYLQHGNT